MEGRIFGILRYNISTFVTFDAEVQLALSAGSTNFRAKKKKKIGLSKVQFPAFPRPKLVNREGLLKNNCYFVCEVADVTCPKNRTLRPASGLKPNPCL